MATHKKSALYALDAKHRLIISIIAAAIIYFLISPQLKIVPRVLITLDVFSIAMLTTSWIIFLNAPHLQIREQAKKQDNSRILVFIILLVACFASMLGVTILLLDKASKHHTNAISVIAVIGGMLFSWLLVHTVFTYHYAHLYYANHHVKENTEAGGLQFPGVENPDFLDFAYFSFVVGMTFQVSDITITGKKIRNIVLVHSLISFFYNTAIIALSINTLSGMGT
jgi:uncharacterized membrane protein